MSQVLNFSFQWSTDCETAFLTLMRCLAYHSDPRIGSGLLQKQADKKLHPVVYASRGLNPAEKNYSVTELETPAIVWGVTHFHSYLYGGGDVTVITDHSAVKPVLEAPNPTGKHAKWWTRDYGRGIKSVNIVYRAGLENKSTDALSRSPVSPAPSHSIGQDEAQVLALTTTRPRPLGTIVVFIHSRGHIRQSQFRTGGLQSEGVDALPLM